MFGNKLLTQIFQIIQKMNEMFDYNSKLFAQIVSHLREELGVMTLLSAGSVEQEFYYWFISEHSDGSGIGLELRLDAIEIACVATAKRARFLDSQSMGNAGKRAAAVAMIDALNERMLEDGFGFQFKDGQIIEFTSEFAYKEVVVPALGLLSNKIFDGANNEFRDAFEEFKLRKYDDCIADCGNALESVIKVIAAKRGWDDVKDSDPAAKLIDALFRHGFVPSYMQDQLKGLRMMLQGAATVRNKEGAHGAGEERRDIERHLAAYQLHQTASAIVFLVEQAGLT